MKPGAFGKVMHVAQNSLLQKVAAPEEISEKYTDAELYRILVAQALTDGAAYRKSDFDAMVRQLGNVRDSDELIAFRELRPGCRAWRHGRSMVCECGQTWVVGDTDPPHCK